jgi:hypothetical protein
MDVLSDVLLAVRLTGAVFFDVDARSPFATETPSAAVIGDQVLPGAQHVISFHLVTEGSCWAEAIDRTDSPVRLQAGDMVVFPGGDANIMASGPGMRGKPVPAQYYRPADRVLPFSLKMTREPNADRTRFVCGFLGCDVRPFNPLLEALPHIVHAPVSEESRQWIASLVAAATKSDAEGAGREAMMAKLAELMFVEAIRSHISHLPTAARGWLAGVRDPQVGVALRLMHGRRPILGPWGAWRARSACRGLRSRSGSRCTCTCRRCSISAVGDCNSRPGCSKPARSASDRQRRRWATSPRPASTEPSSERSGRRRASGDADTATAFPIHDVEAW